MHPLRPRRPVAAAGHRVAIPKQPATSQLQDARPFEFELSCQIAVALFERDGDGERDKVEAPANGFVDAA